MDNTPKLFNDENKDKINNKFLHYDSLYNRKIIENLGTFFICGTSGLSAAILLNAFGIFRGKFSTILISGGISNMALFSLRDSVLYNIDDSKISNINKNN